MKKLNLLLATTAILSLGAIAAKAELDESSVDLNVHVNFIKYGEVIKLQDVDFATFLVSVNDESIINLTMNPSTGALTKGESAINPAHSIGTVKKGMIELTFPDTNPYTLDVGDAVTLSDGKGHNITYTPSFALTDSNEINDDYVTKTYGIGGTLSGTLAAQGEYSGSITVTRVEDPGS